MNNRPFTLIAVLWISLLFFIAAVLLFRPENESALLPASAAAQQFGVNYLWVDTVYTTTAPIDSIFTTQWENVTIIGDTVDMYLKIGAPDTTSWVLRDWFKLESGATINFGSAAKLKRLEWKTAATVGYLTFIGYKRKAQF